MFDIISIRPVAVLRPLHAHAWCRQALSTVTTFGASKMSKVGSEIKGAQLQIILEVKSSQHVHYK